VLTYNVRSCRGGVDAIAQVIQNEAPDIVCLQEYGRAGTLRKLTSSLGLESVSTWRALNRLRNAVLYRIPWEPGDVIRSVLPGQGGVDRGVVAVDLESHGQTLTVASTHLSLRAAERQLQVDALVELLGAKRPLVLAGDFNEDPTDRAVMTLSTAFQDLFAQAGEGRGQTLPASRPTARIDYVFASQDLVPELAWVPASAEAARASDHRPVVADLTLPDR
jgi:endonuclease/exonuclease/phosphatase family metal-dependent hydrolase